MPPITGSLKKSAPRSSKYEADGMDLDLQQRASRNAAARALQKRIEQAIRDVHPGVRINFGTITYDLSSAKCDGFTLELPPAAAPVDDVFNNARLVVADGLDVIRGIYHSDKLPQAPTEEELEDRERRRAAKDKLSEQWNGGRAARRHDVEKERKRLEKELKAKLEIMEGLLELQDVQNARRVERYKKKQRDSGEGMSAAVAYYG